MSISPAPVFWLLAEDPCAGHYLLLSRFFPRKTPFTFAEPSGVARGFIRAPPPMPLAHSARSLPARLHRRSARHFKLLLYTPRRRLRVHARTAPICTRRRVLRPSGPWYGMAMLRRASRAGPGWTASAPVMVQRAPAGPGRPGLLAWPGSGLGR